MTKVLDSFCRTCMVKVAEQTNQIIASFHIFQTEDFAHKFAQCTNLQVHPDDEYPSNVCEKCFASVLSLYDFQIMCRDSIDKFSSMLVENKPEPEISYHLGNNNSSEFLNTMANQVVMKCEQYDLPELAVVGDPLLATTNSQLAEIELQIQAGITDLQATNENQQTDDETTIQLLEKTTESLEKGSEDEMHWDEEKLENTSDEEWCNTDSDCASPDSKATTSLGLPKPKIHMCETCGTVYAKRTSLREHRFLHIDKSEWPFVCDVEGCSKTFHKLAQLKIHQKRHAGIKNYACHHCEMRFVTSTNLKIHINNHTREKTWSCDFCPKVCNTPANLRRHIDNKHGQRAGVQTHRFQCSFCDSAFPSAAGKKYHEMIHTGEKPHVCDECGKKFRQPVALKTHMRTHIKDPPRGHVCRICGSAFFTSQHLQTHMRTHIKDAPRGYVCRICGSAFFTSQNLKHHEMIHTGEKPYKCDECDLTFRWSNNFKVHQRLHQRDKQVKEAAESDKQANSKDISKDE